MGFGQSIRTCFSKYATFSGRASRSEFWWFYLFLVIVGIVLSVIDNVTGLTMGSSTFTVNETVYDAGGVGILSSIFSLATILPFLAVAARRLHDAGHSGLWLIWGFLLSFLCLIGLIILIVFWCQRSQPGETKYGLPPAA